MTEHLEKAKGALEEARGVIADERHDELTVLRLLEVARVQATVSIAESLEKLAGCVTSTGLRVR